MEADQATIDGCLLDNNQGKASGRVRVRLGMQGGKVLLTQGCTVAVESVPERIQQGYEQEKEVNMTDNALSKSTDSSKRRRGSVTETVLSSKMGP